MTARYLCSIGAQDPAFLRLENRVSYHQIVYTHVIDAYPLYSVLHVKFEPCWFVILTPLESD